MRVCNPPSRIVRTSRQLPRVTTCCAASRGGEKSVVAASNMRDTVRINVRGRPPLKQCGLLCLAVGWWIETEVIVCLSGRYASARRPLQKSVLHQERLVDFLESSDVLANGCS